MLPIPGMRLRPDPQKMLASLMIQAEIVGTARPASKPGFVTLQRPRLDDSGIAAELEALLHECPHQFSAHMERFEVHRALDVIEDVLNNNRPLAMNDGTVYGTLQTVSAQSYGDVVFRAGDAADASAIVVGVRDARGQNGRSDWARVLLWGRSTTGGGTGGVVQIDRLLMPYKPSWQLRKSRSASPWMKIDSAAPRKGPLPDPRRSIHWCSSARKRPGRSPPGP